MLVISSDNNCYVDIDETLVFWNTEDYPDDLTITVEDPYIRGKSINLIPHQRNIDLVKRKKGQGKMIIVWSHGGYKWAETVIRALQLEYWVDIILTKPDQYIDDLDIGTWGLSRVYMKKDLAKHPIHGRDLEDGV